MDRGDIVDKVLRLLNYNMKNRKDINKINYDREDVIDFVNRAYQQFMRDTGSGQRKTEIEVELDNDSSFYTPVNADRIENIYYLNEGVQLTIEDFEEVRRQFGRDWDTFTGLPQYATYLNTYKNSYLEGTEITSPENNTINISVLPTIEWEEREWRKYFMLEVSTAEDFSTTVVSQKVLKTSYDVSIYLDYNTDYYIRVKAVDSKGNGIWSDVVNFTTQQHLVDREISLLNKYNSSVSSSDNRIKAWFCFNDKEQNIRFLYNESPLGGTGNETEIPFVLRGKNYSNIDEIKADYISGYRDRMSKVVPSGIDEGDYYQYYIFYSDKDDETYAYMQTTDNFAIGKVSLADGVDDSSEITVFDTFAHPEDDAATSDYNYQYISYYKDNILYDANSNNFYSFRWNIDNTVVYTTYSANGVTDPLGLQKGRLKIIDELTAISVDDTDDKIYLYKIENEEIKERVEIYEDTDNDLMLGSYNIFIHGAGIYTDDRGNKELYITAVTEDGANTSSGIADEFVLYRFLVD